MTQIIAHRGASSDAPENTLAAFRLAWEQGADGIEGDFALSSDGRIVCIHDKDTKRVAGIDFSVSETTLAELQTLDVGAWKGERWRGERIPTLEEVLAIVPAGKKAVLEFKSGPEIVGPLAEVLAAAAISSESVLLISLVDATVAECKRRLPDVKCHWLSAYKERTGNASGTRMLRPTADEVIATIRRLGADGFGSESKPEHFDAAFVEQLRAAGIDEFHVWTVDDPEVAQFYEQLGVWAITTNRPEWLRSEIRN
jgi:glycerophosphoryl diester phosphodiesterase